MSVSGGFERARTGLRRLGTRRSKELLAVFSLLVFALALWSLSHELRAYSLTEIVRVLGRYPLPTLAVAIALTGVSYALMTGFDALGIQYVAASIPYRTIALPAFVSYAVSNNAGFALLTGGSIRYRLYSAHSVSGGDVARIVLWSGVTTWLGFLVLAGVSILLTPTALVTETAIPPIALRLVGVCFLAGCGGYLLVSVVRTRPFHIRAHELAIPSPELASAQLLVSTIDWTAGAAVFYVLLPVGRPSFVAVVSVFVLAVFLGVLSHVPGGLGVFEATIVALLPGSLPSVGVFGALLAYRAIYYLLPLVVAAIILGVRTLGNRHGNAERGVRMARAARIARTATRWTGSIVPDVLAGVTVVAGGVLLVSGTLPGAGVARTTLGGGVSVAVLEFTHFGASVLGAGLLVLGRGLQQRVRAAYRLSVLLLAIGVLVLALGNGLVALVPTSVLALLVVMRGSFYRRCSLDRVSFTPGWIALVVGTFLATVWLGLFAYRHVSYSNQLWWRFALSGDAPRFLRASIGAAGLLLIVAVAGLLSPSVDKPALPSPQEIEAARPIIERSTRREAHLALLGDKALLFDDSREAFVMYQIEGRSWIAMGGPIGPDPARTAAAWAFRERAARAGGRAVFYEIPPEDLSLVIDLGLVPYKLGEQARIPLDSFSLDGSARRKLRYTVRRVERDGGSFEIVPREDVPSILPELCRVSKDWLDRKNTAEKGFSLGFFDEEYLKNFPIAVVRIEGRIVAFANVLESGDELSADLIRFGTDAPPSAMEYIVVKLMLDGKDRGFEQFDLGMAPLSGLDDRPLAPLWNRAGRFVFTHGEHFYNYRGLRTYKEKFDPVWEPRYLACSSGVSLPVTLLNVATLISGGVKDTITK